MNLRLALLQNNFGRKARFPDRQELFPGLASGVAYYAMFSCSDYPGNFLTLRFANFATFGRRKQIEKEGGVPRSFTFEQFQNKEKGQIPDLCVFETSLCINMDPMFGSINIFNISLLSVLTV